jgi:hypothetical protein
MQLFPTRMLKKLKRVGKVILITTQINNAKEHQVQFNKIKTINQMTYFYFLVTLD